MARAQWPDLGRTRRRLRARRIMFGFALLCVAVAVSLGALQLRREGLDQFLYRAPGVGASTPAPKGGGTAQSP